MRKGTYILYRAEGTVHICLEGLREDVILMNSFDHVNHNNEEGSVQKCKRVMGGGELRGGGVKIMLVEVTKRGSVNIVFK